MIETAYDLPDMDQNYLEVIRQDLRRELALFVGPVELLLERDESTRDVRATTICDRALARGAPPPRASEHVQSFPLDYGLVMMLEGRVTFPAAPPLTIGANVAGELARRAAVIAHVARHLAQEVADHACACIRDELAMRGGPRPRRLAAPPAVEPAVVAERDRLIEPVAVRYGSSFFHRPTTGEPCRVCRQPTRAPSGICCLCRYATMRIALD